MLTCDAQWLQWVRHQAADECSERKERKETPAEKKRRNVVDCDECNILARENVCMRVVFESFFFFVCVCII
jgi:hypothetical protein